MVTPSERLKRQQKEKRVVYRYLTICPSQNGSKGAVEGPLERLWEVQGSIMENEENKAAPNFESHVVILFSLHRSSYSGN